MTAAEAATAVTGAAQACDRDRADCRGDERLNQIRAALKPGQTVVADANRGWAVHGALRVCQGIGHLNSIYIEQPCDRVSARSLLRARSARLSEMRYPLTDHPVLM